MGVRGEGGNAVSVPYSRPSAVRVSHSQCTNDVVECPVFVRRLFGHRLVVTRIPYSGSGHDRVSAPRERLSKREGGGGGAGREGGRD